jgi:putative transport protein
MLRQYPEIAIFLSLGIGYYVGKFTFKGIGLGAVTATLLATVVIGQLGITISPPLKAFAFLMFLFAVGYGVGPQFVRGVAKDGLPQAVYAAVVCVLCLGAAVIVARLAGYDLGYAGLYAGSQTISASMGLATDAINRLGLPADQTKGLLDNMPVAYAVWYLFGTVGSAVVIALVGPALFGIDLVAACKDYEAKQGGGAKEMGGAGSAWHRWALRAFRVRPGGKAVGLRAVEAEALVPNARVFVERIRRSNGTIEEATADTVIREGDVIARSRPRPRTPPTTSNWCTPWQTTAVHHATERLAERAADLPGVGGTLRWLVSVLFEGAAGIAAGALALAILGAARRVLRPRLAS